MSGRKTTSGGHVAFQRVQSVGNTYARATTATIGNGLACWFVLIAGGVLLLTRLAWATTVLEVPFSALVQEAEVIAVGTVTAIETGLDAEQGAPFTLVTFSDLEVLKGDDSQTELTLDFLGGPTPDGSIMKIAGVPQFNLDERNVLFITGNQHSAVPLVGMWQGVYRVLVDDKSGLETIHNHAWQPVTRLPTGEGGILTHKAPLVQEQGQPDQPSEAMSQEQGQPDQPSEAMSLDTFSQRIAQELQHSQKN